jgi:hypothetical protein
MAAFNKIHSSHGRSDERFDWLLSKQGTLHIGVLMRDLIGCFQQRKLSTWESDEKFDWLRFDWLLSTKETLHMGV